MMQLLHIVKIFLNFYIFLCQRGQIITRQGQKKEAINEAFPGTECSTLKMDRRPVNQW